MKQYLNRKRTTFHSRVSLDICNSIEWFAYGPESAEAYPLVQMMLAEGLKIFNQATTPIIQASRIKFPGTAWWTQDNELAQEYAGWVKFYTAWKYDAFLIMQRAAWNDTNTYFDAAEAGSNWPFMPCSTPKEAYDWVQEFGEFEEVDPCSGISGSASSHKMSA